MGTARKVTLASLLSTALVLMVAIGLMPSLNALGVFASGDGSKDMGDVLDLIIGNDNGGSKQIATNVLQNQPVDGSTVRVLRDSTRAQLPFNVNLEPAGASGLVTIGIDGSFNAATNTWTGTVLSPTVSSADSIAVTSVDVSALGTMTNGVTAHSIYALASASKVDVIYDVLAQYDLNLSIVDTIDPFVDLGAGEMYLATEVGLDGVNTISTVIADLRVAGTLPSAGVVKGGLDGAALNGVLSVPVTVDTGTGSITYTVQVASTADLKTNIVDGMGTPLIGLLNQAALMVRVSPTLESLVGGVEAANAGADPQVLDFGGQYIQATVIYTTGVGTANTAEIDRFPANVPLVLNVSGASVSDPLTALDGAAIWSHSDTVDSAFMTTIPTGQSWSKREGSVFEDSVQNAIDHVLTVDSLYGSIFGAFDTQLSIAAVTPAAGDPLGGDVIVIDGTFPQRAGVADASAYAVTIDGMAATVNSASASGGNITSLNVTTPATGATSNLTAEVRVTDASTPSDFNTALGGFVYAFQPTITSVDPAFGPIVNGPDVTVTGTNLTSASSVLFGTLAGSNIVVAADGLTLTVTPPDASGPQTVDVTVTTAGGFATLASAYTYLSPPVFTDFTPKSAGSAGGDIMTITGSNLFPVDTLTIAGQSANVATVVDVNGNGSVITVVIPPGPVGTSGVVDVVTPGGADGSADDFSYVAISFSVDSISPDNAWAFGGLVASIQGNGFTAKGIGAISVTIGGVNAPVVGTPTNTEILVKVPAMSVPLSGAGELISDVAVRRGVSPAAATLFNGFTHRSYVKRAGETFTTTAVQLASGAGTVDIVLDGDTFNTTGMTASLAIPSTVFNTGGSTVVLARVSETAGDFGSASTDGNGTDVANTYTRFDVHMYTDTGLNTATGSVFNTGSTLVEITNDLVFDTTMPATLTTWVGTGAITQANAMLGLVNVFRDVPAGTNSTTLDFGYPGMGTIGFGAGSQELFQANVDSNEYLDTTADGNIDQFVMARLGGLGTIMIRDDSVLNFAQLGLAAILDPNGPQEAMTNDAPTPVSLLSALGGLGYVARIDILENGLSSSSGNGSSKVIDRIMLQPDALFSGEPGGDGQVDVTMPTVSEPGIVDIEIFVPGDLTQPAAVIANAFRYRGRVIGGPLAALLALLAILGLAGSGGGGGSGGPCFIATAAYGTPMAAEIDTLRTMRDSYMLDNAVGSAFVELYYSVSPAIADVVAQSPVLGAFVRLLLTPIILMGNMAMAMPTLSAALALMFAAVVVTRRVRRRKS